MDNSAQNNQVQSQGGQGSKGDEGNQPVGSLQKEQGPSQTWQEPVVSQEPPVQVQNEEHLTASEADPEIHPEVAEAGVKAVEKPQVGQDVIKVGLEPAKEEVLVATQPSGLVKLPMTKEEAEKIVKLHKRV